MGVFRGWFDGFKPQNKFPIFFYMLLHGKYPKNLNFGTISNGNLPQILKPLQNFSWPRPCTRATSNVLKQTEHPLPRPLVRGRRGQLKESALEVDIPPRW